MCRHTRRSIHVLAAASLGIIAPTLGHAGWLLESGCEHLAPPPGRIDCPPRRTSAPASPFSCLSEGQPLEHRSVHPRPSDRSGVIGVTASAELTVGPGPTVYRVEAQPFPGSCHYSYIDTDPLPDPICTPGAINPRVTQTDISSTICRGGYARSIRPPESITEPEKIASARAYAYTGPLRTAEYDHLVPLELGGDPNDPANLWLEPNDISGATTSTNSKDRLEDRLHWLVCKGVVPLAVAQEAIASNWVTAFRKYVGPLPKSPAPRSAPTKTTSSVASSKPAMTIDATSPWLDQTNQRLGSPGDDPLQHESLGDANRVFAGTAIGTIQV